MCEIQIVHMRYLHRRATFHQRKGERNRTATRNNRLGTTTAPPSIHTNHLAKWFTFLSSNAKYFQHTSPSTRPDRVFGIGGEWRLAAKRGKEHESTKNKYSQEKIKIYTYTHSTFPRFLCKKLQVLWMVFVVTMLLFAKLLVPAYDYFKFAYIFGTKTSHQWPWMHIMRSWSERWLGKYYHRCGKVRWQQSRRRFARRQSTAFKWFVNVVCLCFCNPTDETASDSCKFVVS